MQKIQVLLPDPLMSQVRRVAQAEDMSVSEVLRRAAEEWLAKRRFVSGSGNRKLSVPFFRGGKVLVSSEEMKRISYEHDD